MAESGAPGSPESGNTGERGGGSAREQDRFIPIVNIGRIIRKAVPENGKVAKDAKGSVQECVSESSVSSPARRAIRCRWEKRKAIDGDDLLWAMGTLVFEEYVKPLELYLQLYREMEESEMGQFMGAWQCGRPLISQELGHLLLTDICLA